MIANLAPRLLKKADAARYCGLDAKAFLRECPVAPVCFGERTYRYDRKALDRWLDGLGNSLQQKSDEEWLGLLNGDEDAREGH